MVKGGRPSIVVKVLSTVGLLVAIAVVVVISFGLFGQTMSDEYYKNHGETSTPTPSAVQR